VTARKSACGLVAASCAGLAGAALLSLPAAFYRVDRASCATWPAPALNTALATVYLLAVALLTWCWFGWWFARPRLGTVLAAGLAVHAVALVAPPFLSTDSLFYAAIGRAMATYHASPHVSFAHTFSSDDSLFRLLSEDWQQGASPYSIGWNQLARTIAWLAGDSLLLQLRLHQAVGLASMGISAALIGLAVRMRDPARGGSAAAAVLFCPLAVIEATSSAHNDCLLALAIALLVIASERARPGLSLLGAATGLLVKVSALIPLGFTVVAVLGARLGLTRARLAAVLLVLVLAALASAGVLQPWVQQFTDLFNPGALQCARALECLPRWLLWRSRHFTAAFAIGICFRLAALAWLGHASLRALEVGKLLPALASGLFVYYLYFHAYVQPWYLLPLLPLLPFASAQARPAMAAACVCWLIPHTLQLVFNCRASSAQLWLERGIGVALVTALPTVLLWRGRSLAGAGAA
jgi:hypothetical protein